MSHRVAHEVPAMKLVRIYLAELSLHKIYQLNLLMLLCYSMDRIQWILYKGRRYEPYVLQTHTVDTCLIVQYVKQDSLHFFKSEMS